MDENQLENISMTERAKKYIENYINKMDLEKDNRLPSETLLSQKMGVSRATVRSALEELSLEGKVRRRHGVGTFVNIEALEMKVTFNPVHKFEDMIKNSGYIPGVKIFDLEIEKMTEEIAEKLDILIGENPREVIKAKKIFYADKKPCAYCIDYFDRELVKDEFDLEKLKDYKKSIFNFVYQCTGKKVVWDRVEIDTISNYKNKELKEMFSEDGNKSYLLLKGTNFTEDNLPIIYAEEHIDTKFIKFNMIRQRLIEY